MDYLGILKNNGFVFSKKFGQNFITDLSLLRAIVADAEVDNDLVIEVGCGAGTLTRCLCERASRVIGFEIDERLRSVLDVTLDGIPNVQIEFADVMKLDDGELYAITQRKPFKLVANLPYYITTPLLFRFLYLKNLSSLTVMVQKEVAQRMCAKADTANYGALTAQLALMGDAKYLRTVSRSAFTPSPNVDSAVVRLDIAPKCDESEIKKVKRLIATAFAMRRKTLANNLSSAYGINKGMAIELIQKAGFREDVRGETLDVSDFIHLSKFLS